jgi:hypothetical protein
VFYSIVMNKNQLLAHVSGSTNGLAGAENFELKYKFSPNVKGVMVLVVAFGLCSNPMFLAANVRLYF